MIVSLKLTMWIFLHILELVMDATQIFLSYNFDCIYTLDIDKKFIFVIYIMRPKSSNFFFQIGKLSMKIN